MYLSADVHMKLSADAYGDQEKASELLELELQVDVSHLMWALKTKYESSPSILTAEPSLRPLFIISCCQVE